MRQKQLISLYCVYILSYLYIYHVYSSLANRYGKSYIEPHQSVVDPYGKLYKGKHQSVVDPYGKSYIETHQSVVDSITHVVC